jgi:hypothetical protein
MLNLLMHRVTRRLSNDGSAFAMSVSQNLLIIALTKPSTLVVNHPVFVRCSFICKNEPRRTLYRVIRKSFWECRPLRYSSRYGHGETLEVSVLPYRCSIAPFCCVCLGCCAAEFGSSGGTYELPCM